MLRSPPFPGVAVDQATVSLVAEATRSPGGHDSVEERDRVRSLLAEILRARVGGTFWAPPAAGADSVEALLRPRTAAEARAMADAALADLTPANVLALLPDAAWAPGARRLLAKRGIAAEIGDVDPWPLLATASRLHAAGDDELAFLALLAGLRVHCVADGAIAGWGLTDDDPAIPSKGRLRLEQLAGTILIDQARYRDCYSGLPTEVETVVERLALWRSCIDANRPIAVGAGIAVWKRREIAAMLWAGRRQPLRFCQRAASAVAAASAAGGAIAVWPSRAPAGLAEVAAGAGVPLHRIEDGFVRSVGLGSALHPPLSVVVDSRGVHYDPTQPSDLETILAEAEFPIELTERAEALAAFIVGAGISKYSSGRGGSTPLPTGVRRVLVPGQVEDDLSVRLGGGDVQGNLDLLRRVRAQEPDAFLIFKPHPDVEAGHRPGHVPDAEALTVADRIVRDVPMAALLDDVDAIHVLTSLAGFEALLRGVEVVTHGAPFYAGWGLTRDLAGPFPRRGRTLALPELVAAALILYPRYLDPVTRLPCPPEILLSRLSEQRIPAPTWLTRVRGVQGRLRRPMRWARSAA